MVTSYLAITWNAKRKVWQLQPCRRVRRGHWTYAAPLVGEQFLTKREANDRKRELTRMGWN